MDQLSSTSLDHESTETSTEASVTWSFIATRYRERKGETSTSNPALDRVNAMIWCWQMLRDSDPEYAAEIA